MIVVTVAMAGDPGHDRAAVRAAAGERRLRAGYGRPGRFGLRDPSRGVGGGLSVPPLTSALLDTVPRPNLVSPRANSTPPARSGA
jgi:hypothetical protein